MSIADLISSMPTDIALDLFSAIVLIILLLSFTSDPFKKAKKSINSFRLFLVCELFTAIFDMGQLYYTGHVEYIKLYSFLVYSCFACSALSLTFIVAFVLALIQEKQRVSRTFLDIVFTFTIMLAGLFMIPGIKEEVVIINPNATYVNGPAYVVAEMLVVIAPFIFDLIIVYYAKALGMRDAFLLCVILSVQMMAALQSSRPGVPTVSITTFMALLVANVTYRRRSDLITEQEAKLTEQELELTKSKINIMVSQIQPHFLYNTLNSIAGLCTYDPVTAQKVTSDFSDYLRGNLDALDETETIPFVKELEHTKLYTDIEKIRFAERLTLKYDIRVDCFKMPPLTLQPIVENAIKHGVCKKKKGGWVEISTLEDEKFYYVVVKDNGVGFNTSKCDDDGRNHYGIELVGKRIEMICNGSLNIESEIGKGTKATISIPKSDNQETNT